jgi:hypothetical protein
MCPHPSVLAPGGACGRPTSSKSLSLRRRFPDGSAWRPAPGRGARLFTRRIAGYLAHGRPTGYGGLGPHQGRFVPLRQASGDSRRKRPASRFLDPRLASPWGIVVARARDGKTTLAAGAASGSELGREDEERKRDPSHRVSEAPCPVTGLSRAPRALRLHGFPYFR